MLKARKVASLIRREPPANLDILFLSITTTADDLHLSGIEGEVHPEGSDVLERTPGEDDRHNLTYHPLSVEPICRPDDEPWLIRVENSGINA